MKEEGASRTLGGHVAHQGSKWWSDGRTLGGAGVHEGVWEDWCSPPPTLQRARGTSGHRQALAGRGWPRPGGAALYEWGGRLSVRMTVSGTDASCQEVWGAP